MDTSLPYPVAYCGLSTPPSLLSPLAEKRLRLVIQSGMAVVLVEGEDQLDALIRQGNSPDPTTPLKSGTAPSYIFNFSGSLIVLGTMLNALVAFP